MYDACAGESATKFYVTVLFSSLSENNSNAAKFDIGTDSFDW